ncbi:MAG: secreted protein [Nocardioidaceae bacterium]|nr:secreted protein [Nocardioidaceae bacterium]
MSDEPSEPAGRTSSPAPAPTRSVRTWLSTLANPPGWLRHGRRPAVAAVVVAGLTLGGVAAGNAAAEDSGADGVAASASDFVAAPGDSRDRAGVTGAPAASEEVSRGGARPALTGAATTDGTRNAASRGGGNRASVPPDRQGAEAGVSGSATVQAPADPRDIARVMLARHGWSGSQFSCLDALWIGESNWDPLAENPTSGAYGIPQSLPADKMAAAGPDWRTNPVTQIKWGLSYIAAVYGSPCAANSFKMANNWY